MRIYNQNKNYKKRMVIITSLIAALLIGGAVFAWFSPLVPFFGNKSQEIRPENTVDYSKPSTEQKNTGEAQKTSTTVPNQDTKTTTPSTQPANTSDFNVTFSALNQVAGTIQIRSLIDAVSDNGTCMLTLTKGTATVTKQSGLQAGPSSSTCKGFDISTGELSPGTWRVSLSVAIDARNGSVSKDLTVQ